MNNNPGSLIDNSPMAWMQIIVVMMCILLNALDGFDVLSIAFASPGIAQEFEINRAVLGVVLSMELMGMAVGSVILGNVADKIGRRPIILFCLAVMAMGMYFASGAQSVNELSVHRFYTGLAIGGMLATTNAMVAEFSNRRHRSLCVMLMAGGYPLGVVIGGTIASGLLAHDSWRAIFEFGAIATISFFPLVWFLVPESVAYHTIQRGTDSLVRINSSLKKMGKEPIAALPDVTEKPKTSLLELFKPAMLRTTIVLTVAYFMHIMTLYFLLKWTPKIVVDMGYSASSAGGVLVWANLGMLTGSILFGLLSSRFATRNLMFVALVMSSIMIYVFGKGYSELDQLSAVACIAGFFINGGVVGLYALFADHYPDNLRASGTGFSIGLGRGGAAASPIIAGILFTAGYGLSLVATFMAFGSVVAAIVLVFLKARAFQR
ncbi:MAG TPA: MFS transporter [Gammaproteobacteria bacterium]|nr:MFS transporter [Gammaproteobacteria bacterium]HIK70387.1 MFS transporter [Pseudomonadales bacterium]